MYHIWEGTFVYGYDYITTTHKQYIYCYSMHVVIAVALATKLVISSNIAKNIMQTSLCSTQHMCVHKC